MQKRGGGCVPFSRGGVGQAHGSGRVCGRWEKAASAWGTMGKRDIWHLKGGVALSTAVLEERKQQGLASRVASWAAGCERAGAS